MIGESSRKKLSPLGQIVIRRPFIVFEFARRLEQLLRDKTLARTLGQRGLKLVNERFDFANYISELEQMFAAVLAESASPDRVAQQTGAPRPTVLPMLST